MRTNLIWNRLFLAAFGAPYLFAFYGFVAIGSALEDSFDYVAGVDEWRD